MKILIFCGGEIKDYRLIKGYVNADRIICADSGARHARKLGLVPDLLLGDFDSVNKEDFNFYREKEVKMLEYPQDKDYTDTELAIEQAFSMNPSEIILLGATGGRLDHTMANIFLLRKILEKGILGKIVTENDEVFLVSNHAVIEGNSEDKLTLLALDDEVSGVTTKGLLYQLEDETLYSGSSRGVSNLFACPYGEIYVKNGILMVIKSREKK